MDLKLMRRYYCGKCRSSICLSQTCLPDRGKSRRLDSMKYSCSAICYHWGLDKVYPQLGHHSVFLSDGFREGLDRIFKDKSVSDHPSFYVHAPVRTDPSAAPKIMIHFRLLLEPDILIKRKNRTGMN